MSILKSVADKPWEYQPPSQDTGPESAFGFSPERVALALFLIIVGIIFSLLAVTYFLRMDLGDWVPLSDPAMLWINTAVLIASSVFFQWAQISSRRDERRLTRRTFIVGGVLALLFIAGQLAVWQQLDSSGFGVQSNPASAFFYLLTGLHAAHLLGGLWVWSKTSFRLFRDEDPRELELSVQLCTTYWHFLLLLWVVLFALLANT